jgi:hypothetical protein
VREGQWSSAPFDAIDGLVRGPRGVLGWIGRRGPLSVVVVAEHEEPGVPRVIDLALGARGRFAYVAEVGGQAWVVSDRGRAPLGRAVSGTLTFDAAGEVWGCMALDAARRSLVVIVEGGRRRRVDAEELVALVAKPAPEDRIGAKHDLRSWVAAELEIAAGR